MASKDSTPANTISSRGNGCISFDECMDIFKRGGACQMQYNGQWIPFDPNVVIRDFRIAPQLTQKDGAKIVRYALYRLGEILDQMCSGMYFPAPISSRVPAMILTILKRNPFPVIVNVIRSPSLVTLAS